MADDNHTIGTAEHHIRHKNYLAAVALLEPLISSHPLARRLLFDCYVELNDDQSLISHFYPPTTPSQVVHIADALWTLDRVKLKHLLDSDIVTSSADHTVQDICAKYRARLSQ